MSASIRNLERAAQVQFVRAQKAEQKAEDIQHALNLVLRSMQQVERVGCVIDEEHFAFQRPQPKQSAGARRWTSGTIDQLGVDLTARPDIHFHHIPVISIRDIEIVANQRNAQWIIQRTARGKGPALAVGLRPSEGIRNSCDSVVKTVSDKEIAGFEVECYSGRSDDQCCRVGSFWESGGNDRTVD